MDAFELPECIQKVCVMQKSAPFGVAMLKLADNVRIGYEICEELWSPKSIGVTQCLSGADIIFNSSASHHSLYKYHRRAGLIASASYRGHCFYYFSNMSGCDGDRMLFDGGCILARNGDFLQIGDRFQLEEVSVMCSRVDLDEIRAARSSIGSRQVTAAVTEKFNEVNVGSNFTLESGVEAKKLSARRGSCISIQLETNFEFDKQQIEFTDFDFDDGEELRLLSDPIDLKSMEPEEEICSGGPMLFLFDYLRRSGMTGYLLPLSGGIDSAATACIVYGLACKLFENSHLVEVENLLLKIGAYSKSIDGHSTDVSKVKSPKDIMKKLLYTIYLPNKGMSSDLTESLAYNLAREIGASHSTIGINPMVEQFTKSLPSEFSKPGFGTNKTWQNNLAMENLQARTRMVTAYMAAASVDNCRGKLVLASSNADECLTGYLTKYDCSSGDVNAIGAISKEDLKSVVKFMAKKYKISSLEEIASSKPSAELKPLDTDGKYSQTDEEDMGLTYQELQKFGRLRIENRCGPISMYKKLVAIGEMGCVWFEGLKLEMLA